METIRCENEKEIITYDLRLGQENSEVYYKRVKEVAQTILKRVTQDFEEIIKDFCLFIENHTIEGVRMQQEYGLEIVTLAVLWKAYGGYSLGKNKVIQKLLRQVVKLRRGRKIKKQVFSTLKGRLLPYFLVEKEANSPLLNSPLQLKEFLDWLQASGEFEEEVRRLRRWQLFLEETEVKGTQVFQEFSRQLQPLALFFETISRKQLKEFTPHVENYRLTVRQKHKNKEDLLFCSRQLIEYYLNMVGAEILNEAFRPDFLHTKEKLILLPGCMPARKEKCQAVSTSQGYDCKGCTHYCPVYRIKKIAQPYGARTFVIHHESELYQKVEEKKEGIGLIGIACVLNLLSGGWKAKRMGYIPQCVLLDYCGCKQHWHPTGLVTELNEKRLESLL